MGVVYLAVREPTPVSSRQVAIKVLRTSVDQREIPRFASGENDRSSAACEHPPASPRLFVDGGTDRSAPYPTW